MSWFSKYNKAGFDKDGQHRLHNAATAGDVKEIEKELGSGIDVDIQTKDGHGVTPLYCATKGNRIEAMKLVISRKANVGKSNSTGWSPLMVASYQGLQHAVKLLLDSKASLAQQKDDKSTALDLAHKYHKDEIVDLLYDESGFNDRGQHRIHAAAVKGDVKAIDAQLAQGVDIYLSTHRNPPDDAVYLAAKSGKTQALDYLLSRKADINHANSLIDNSPLRRAVCDGEVEAVKLLLSRKADMNRTDIFDLARFYAQDPQYSNERSNAVLAVLEGHDKAKATLAAPTSKPQTESAAGDSKTVSAAQSSPSTVLSSTTGSSSRPPLPSTSSAPAASTVAPSSTLSLTGATSQTASKFDELKAMFVKLDLVNYVQAFADEEVFVTDLPNVEKDVIDKLIPRAGPRSRLLTYISSLSSKPISVASDAKASDMKDADRPVSTDVATAESKLVNVEKDESNEAAEFWTVDKEFKAGLNNHIEDYNELRIKKGLAPIGFRLVAVQKVVNPVLEARFAQFQSRLKADDNCNAEEKRARYAFHGTHPLNIKKICDKGLLRVGHPLNPSKRIDEGYFGKPEFGVYADYTFKYSNQLETLEPKDEVKVLMLRVLPGRSRHIEKRTPGLVPSDSAGYHSHSSSNFQEWYLFNEEQCCPAYVLTVRAFEDRRTPGDDT